MPRIYFDNAATTSLDPQVLEAMMPYLTEHFGNPSSIYSYGRESKMGIEGARKSVARILNTKPGNIFFTSGGTESTNTAIRAAIKDLGCKHIITSPIEHHATLHCSEYWEQEGLKLSYVSLKEDGKIDIESLKTILANSEERCLVTLMHANNEIGNLLPIKAVGEICKEYDAIFHCDTVQTVGHFPIDLSEIHVHFINGAGHKFHGPKGVGILYVNHELVCIKPLINGGAQERNMRAGTENIYGIVGFAKALEMATEHYEEHKKHILEVRDYLAEQLMTNFEGITINGDWKGESLYTVLNVSFPHSEKADMLLFNLDMNGICVSGGSACSSGASKGSHVISAAYPEQNAVPIRFSFSKNNTKEEVDIVVAQLKAILG